MRGNHLTQRSRSDAADMSLPTASCTSARSSLLTSIMYSSSLIILLFISLSAWILVLASSPDKAAHEAVQQQFHAEHAERESQAAQQLRFLSHSTSSIYNDGDSNQTLE